METALRIDYLTANNEEKKKTYDRMAGDNISNADFKTIANAFRTLYSGTVYGMYRIDTKDVNELT